MKTTIDIADNLLIEAKKLAAEQQCSLRQIVELSLRSKINKQSNKKTSKNKKIRWITVPGKINKNLDLKNREAMHEWLNETA